ncbi:MAG TPA: 50S ribosomal protein L11 methyltransferase [Pyrinomonadaceae bacterium]|nr:50S ribosomal protein L11 methyltransferase [Pyrinomonadaceae bacterium]
MSHAKEKPERWYALDVDLEPAAREAVEYALMEAGALGTETRDEQAGLIRVVAYFADTPDRERVRNELFEALRIYELPSSSVRDMNAREVAQHDWLEEWKQNWQPVEIGRFIIAPPWSNLDEVHDHLIIRIEPGMAFGTGTHETTRLCLAAIQKHFAGGSFLDVGTGTGILAIAAAKLFPEAHIEACDTDETAIEIACENAAANDVAQIEFWVGSVAESTASADLVCANLTADVITQILPALVGVTCGKLILSGILETQVEMVQAGLHDNGIDEFEIEQDGEWVALII